MNDYDFNFLFAHKQSAPASPTSEFVQVLHVNGYHWITISNIGVSDNSVNVYDSLYNGITQTTKELIAKYVHKEKVKINIINVQQQENDSDCGVFAIASNKYKNTGMCL